MQIILLLQRACFVDNSHVILGTDVQIISLNCQNWLAAVCLDYSWYHTHNIIRAINFNVGNFSSTHHDFIFCSMTITLVPILHTFTNTNNLNKTWTVIHVIVAIYQYYFLENKIPSIICGKINNWSRSAFISPMLLRIFFRVMSHWLWEAKHTQSHWINESCT